MPRFDGNRGFGVEIEIRTHQVTRDGRSRRISQSQVARWLNTIEGVEAGAEGLNHTTRSYWKVVTDSTCGFEVVSPILRGEDGLNQLKAVIRKLKAHGCIVDSSTGFHVHHGVRQEGITANQLLNICAFYAKYQTTIDRLVHSSRRNNRWTAPWTPTQARMAREMTFNADIASSLAPMRTRDQIFAAVDRTSLNLRNAGGGRYKSVNFSATLPPEYGQQCHGTVEFRQKEGTLDADEAAAWVVMTQLIVTYAIKVDEANQACAANSTNSRRGGAVVQPTPLSAARQEDGLRWLETYLNYFGKWKTLEKDAWAVLTARAS